jgi:hypothetical protein
MNFEPSNTSWKIQGSIGILIPKVGVQLRMCGFIPSHSWVAVFACTFPCLCLGREPKVKVVTLGATLHFEFYAEGGDASHYNHQVKSIKLQVFHICDLHM